MKKNRLRELLNEGKPTLSTRMITMSPQLVEMIGFSGAFDFIELMAEYAPWTLPDLENFARAVELFPHMSSMIKVEREPRLFVTQRALGAGIQNVLFADCDTAEEVAECISYIRPLLPEDGGLHGCSARRANSYILESGSAEWAQAQRDVVVELMVESKKATDNLDEILSVRGVDLIHLGPCDYSLSVGKTWQKGNPEIKKLEQMVIEKALKKGVRYRAIVNSHEQVKAYMDMGVRDFCFSNDLGIIYDYCKLNGEKTRELLAHL